MKWFFGVLILILAAICPLSIWINISLFKGINRMQYHIDFRDSLLDSTRQKYYNSLDTIDSLKFRILIQKYKPL